MVGSISQGGEFQGYRDILGNSSVMNDIVRNYAQNNPAMNSLDLSARDVMTQSDADRLNAIAQDIGSPERYSAGMYQGGGAQSLINNDQFKQGLLNSLAAYRSAMASDAPYIAPAGTAQIVDNTNYGVMLPNTPAKDALRNSVIWDDNYYTVPNRIT